MPGTFSLAYVVFNTIENLTTQEAQVACFRNVAAHLEPGGSFLVEVEVPPLRWLAAGEAMRVFHASDAHWGIDEVDVARQGVVSHHFEQVEGHFQRLSMPFRYAWAAELDLMAELAGMTLAERWGGWNREPFTTESRSVSVWRKTAPRALPAEGTLRRAFPDEGLTLGDLVVRLRRPGDDDAVAAAFADDELREAGNLPALGVGNHDSERVLERAGFTREGVVRSLPKPDGRRVDETLFSLLRGESRRDLRQAPAAE